MLSIELGYLYLFQKMTEKTEAIKFLKGNQLWVFVVSLLIILIVGVFLGWVVKPAPDTSKILEERLKLEKLVWQKELEITSLKTSIQRRESIILSLKDSVVVIEKIRIKEVDKVRKLPIDSGAQYLKDKLNAFEKLFN